MTTEHLRFLKKFRRRRQMVVFLRILILFLFLLQWEICADTGVVDSLISLRTSSVGIPLSITLTRFALPYCVSIF